MSTPVRLVMVNDDLTPSTEADGEWGRRRGNLRHEVELPAVITDRVCGPMACVIEDVSASGMLLTIELIVPEPGREPLQQGTRAELEFAPGDDDAPGDNVCVPVEIMWRTPVAVGVRFVEMSAALRDALRTIASRAVEGRAGGTSETRQQATAERRRVLLACRKTVQRLLPNIMWILRTEVTKRLRAAAESLPPAEAEQARAEAARIDEKANAIGLTIERHFLQGYAVASDLDQTQELTMSHLAGTFGAGKSRRPQLVAAKAVDQNARILAIGLAAEEKYKSAFFGLNVRLANVIGHPLDDATNPLVPATACRILWEATVAQCDSPRVQLCLQQALQTRVVPLLGELYAAIHKTLDEEGAQRIFDLR